MSKWQKDFDHGEKLLRKAMELARQRSKLKPNSSAYSILTDQVQEASNQLKIVLQCLEQSLRHGIESVTEGEEHRRQTLLDGLRSKDRKLKDALNEAGERQAQIDARSRALLLEGKGVSDMGASGWSSGLSSTTYEEAPSTSGIATQQLRLNQDEIIAVQDEGLDTLHEVIVRQKRIAQTIGGEVEVQNELLDDIGDGMDQTTQRLLDTTRTVTRVGQSDRTCKYWIIILVLFVAIVIVSFL